METHLQIKFDQTPEPSLCALVNHFKHMFAGTVVYPSDGYSVYFALSIAGIDNLLPVSLNLTTAFPCLAGLAEVQHIPASTDLFAGYAWAIKNVLWRSSTSLLFNADHYHNAVASQASPSHINVRDGLVRQEKGLGGGYGMIGDVAVQSIAHL